jgi:hypothetical protein
VCARFVISGSLMLAAIALRGGKLPRGRDLRAACLSGVLVLGIGNGALVFAEQWVPSGLACLIITISPFWMVGAEALLPGGEPLHLPTILGMLVGWAARRCCLRRTCTRTPSTPACSADFWCCNWAWRDGRSARSTSGGR